MRSLRIAALLLPASLCLGFASPLLAGAGPIVLQPVAVGEGYDTLVHITNASGVTSACSLILQVGASTYGPVALTLSSRRSASVSLQELFPNVGAVDPDVLNGPALGSVLVSDDLPDGSLIARAETSGPWYSWNTAQGGATAGLQTAAPLALLGGYCSTWVQLYNGSTTISAVTLGGTAYGSSTGTPFTLPNQDVQIQPGEVLTLRVPADNLPGPALARLTLTASPGSSLPAAAALSLDQVSGGAVTSPFFSSTLPGQTWVLPYFAVQGQQKATLLVPQSKGGTTVAELHFGSAGQSSLTLQRITLNSGNGPVAMDLSSLLSASPVEGYLLVSQRGLADGAPPALLTNSAAGKAAVAFFQPAAGPPVPLGNLVSAPLRLSDAQSAKVGFYNGSNHPITVLLRFRASGEGSSDIPNDDFTAVAPPAAVLPAGGWMAVDLSGLIARYGPYDSGFFEAIYSGLPGAVFAQAGALGPDEPATTPLAPVTLDTMLSFSTPYAIVGPSPVELAAGATVPVQALLWGPKISAVAPPQSWSLRANQGGSQPAAAINATGQSATITGSATTSAQSLTILPSLLPPGGGGDDVPDPGEGVLYAPGPIPTPTSASPHYGRKEGGDPLTIGGSGFDSGGTQVKFRRTLSNGTTANNRSEYRCPPCYTTFRSDAVGNISNVTTSTITMGPGGNCTQPGMCGTNKSCDGHYGNVRLIVTNLATNNHKGLGWSNGAGFKYGWPTPTIGSVSPGTGPISGGTTVTINGTGFAANVSGFTVKIGGISLTNVGYSNVQPDGTYNTVTGTVGTEGWWFADCSGTKPGVTGVAQAVKVTNPDGNQGTLASAFTFTAVNPAITGVSPLSGPTLGGTPVTLNGTSLMRITSVLFNSSYLATCGTIQQVSGGMKVTSPAGCGAGPIKVQTRDNAAATTNVSFAYTTVTPALSSYVQNTTACSAVSCTVTLNFNKGMAPCDNISASATSAYVMVAPATVTGLSVSNSNTTAQVVVGLKLTCPASASVQGTLVVPVTYPGGTANCSVPITVSKS